MTFFAWYWACVKWLLMLMFSAVTALAIGFATVMGIIYTILAVLDFVEKRIDERRLK